MKLTEDNFLNLKIFTMTKQQALQNIGERFKVIGLRTTKDDHIISVDPDGTIHGEFTIASCEDCRLMEKQPEQLRSQKVKQQLIDRGWTLET
jgi:hypothetical protein